MREFRPSMYKHLIDAPLQCFRCDQEFKFIPPLKKHLQEEFDAMVIHEKDRAAREQERLEKKRKREEARAAKAAAASASPPSNPSAATVATAPKDNLQTQSTTDGQDNGSPPMSPPVKRQATDRARVA